MAGLGLPECRVTQTGPPQLPSQGRMEQPSCSGLASPCMAAGGESQAQGVCACTGGCKRPPLRHSLSFEGGKKRNKELVIRR